MSAQASLNVLVTPELEAFIRDRIASGRYLSSSEVVREGLLLLQSRERESDERLAAFQEKIQRSTEQAERGEVVDGEQYFEELLTRIDKGRARNEAV